MPTISQPKIKNDHNAAEQRIKQESDQSKLKRETGRKRNDKRTVTTRN